MKQGLTFLSLVIFYCGAAHAETVAAESTPSTVMLRFAAQEQDLNYITTYSFESSNLINISDDTGKSDTLKNETREYGELLKRQLQLQNSSLIQIADKISFLKAESVPHTSERTRPVDLLWQIEPQGRLQIPFSMQQFPFLGIPVSFPEEPVKVGQVWAGSLDFHDEELPPLNLNQKFTLKKITEVGGHSVAEIEYTLQAELHATDLNEDSIIQQKIAELKSRNIESVSYDGKGTLAFDFVNGRIQTHLLTVTARLSRAYISGNKRTLKETTTSYEFAEAMLP